MQARYMRRWRELAYDPTIGHKTVELSDGGISERHARGAGEWSWEGVHRIHDLPGAVIIEVSDWHAITLPNRLWAEPGDRDSFVKAVRQKASGALPDLPKSRIIMGTGSGMLTLGAVAAAFDLFILINVAVGLTGFDNCSCAVRRTLWFHAFVLTMVVVTLGAFFLTKSGLERLKRSYPRLATSMAVVAMALLAAVLLAAMVAHHAALTRPAS